MKYLPKNNKEKSTQRIYLPELDGLRFFAFLLVFVNHQYSFLQIPYLSVLHRNGWIGVDLFFSLSAFLFTKLLLAEHDKTRSISFKKFYLRRIFRIWPIFFLFIGVSVSIYLFQNGTIPLNKGIRVLGLFAFSDNIITAIYGYNPLPYVAHLWTIAYEEQFYIFIPLIIFILVRSSFKTKIVSLIIVFILFNIVRLVMIITGATGTAIWVLPITHFESIILGIVIGFGGFDFLSKKVKPLTIGLIGILFFVLIALLPDPEKISYWMIATYSFVGISTSFVLYSVLKNEYLKTLLSKKVFVYLGKRSYGLYVYHLLGNGVASYSITHIPGIPSNTLFYFLYSLSFTVIVSVFSYRIIETPFLKLKKKFEIIISRPI